MRVIDIEFGDRATGVTVSAHADGISIDGWYDSMVGLGVDAFVSWERLDELKVKARRRKPFVREEEV